MNIRLLSKSICLSVCPSVSFSVCLSVYLYVCMYVSVSVCLSIWLSIYMYFCLSVCLPVCLSVYLSVCSQLALFSFQKHNTEKETLYKENCVNKIGNCSYIRTEKKSH